MTSAFKLGLAAAILCAVLFCVLSLLLKGGRGGKVQEYDERQTAARGMAYKVGLLTMCVSNCAIGAICVFNPRIMDTFTAMFTSMIIGISAFVIAAIRKDAYLALHQDKRRLYIVGGVLCACNLIPSIGTIISGEMYVDGQLSVHFVSLMIAILWLVIIGMLFLHDRTEQDEEEA